MVNSPKEIESKEMNPKKVATNTTNNIDDDYENEFERVMEEQEKKETHQNCNISSGGLGAPSAVSEECGETNRRTTPTKCDPFQCNKPKINTHAIVDSSIKTKASTKISSSACFSIEYPPELNPFGDDESDKVRLGANQAGTTKEVSNNPFGDSDEEDVSRPLVVSKPARELTLLPKPAPRHGFSAKKKIVSSVPLNPFWKDGAEPPDDTAKQNRHPVPLPRTVSKSMPSTPDQSPLLRLSRSFRQSGSCSPSSPGTPAYYSMRRKKKPAPPPPNGPSRIPSPTSTVLSSEVRSPKPASELASPTDPSHTASQIEVASAPLATRIPTRTVCPVKVADFSSNGSVQGTLVRPRKARPAPPPPPSKSVTLVHDIKEQKDTDT